MSEKDGIITFVTLSGSLHRHIDDFNRIAGKFEASGATVLSPKKIKVKREDDEGYVYLVDDHGEPEEIENAHLVA